MLSSNSIKLNSKPKKKRALKISKDPDRVALSQCVGKLMAYVRVGKKEEAKEWALKLQEHLKRLDLLPK